MSETNVCLFARFVVNTVGVYIADVIAQASASVYVLENIYPDQDWVSDNFHCARKCMPGSQGNS